MIFLILISCVSAVNCHLGIFICQRISSYLDSYCFSSKDRESVALDGFILGVCTRPVFEMFCDAVADTFSGAVGEFERKRV